MPVFVGVGIMFVQICTGINTIIYYTTTIFKIAGFSSTIGAIYATIGIGTVNFLMTLVAIFLHRQMGTQTSALHWPLGHSDKPALFGICIPLFGRIGRKPQSG